MITDMAWNDDQRDKPPFVVFDVDGVLADMSAWEHLLRNEAAGARQRWRDFLSHVGDATLIESGAQLVHRTVAAGLRIRYSTTRPQKVAPATVEWLQACGLPAKRVYSRFVATQPPLQVKLDHCKEVTERGGKPIAGFVDDEAQIVQELRAAGWPAFRAVELAEHTPAQLTEVFAPAAARS
jgi:phosphoglycolate phosphatase-like HAD superfamily hydrolase